MRPAPGNRGAPTRSSSCRRRLRPPDPDRARPRRSGRVEPVSIPIPSLPGLRRRTPMPIRDRHQPSHAPGHLANRAPRRLPRWGAGTARRSGGPAVRRSGVRRSGGPAVRWLPSRMPTHHGWRCHEKGSVWIDAGWVASGGAMSAAAGGTRWRAWPGRGVTSSAGPVPPRSGRWPWWWPCWPAPSCGWPPHRRVPRPAAGSSSSGGATGTTGGPTPVEPGQHLEPGGQRLRHQRGVPGGRRSTRWPARRDSPQDAEYGEQTKAIQLFVKQVNTSGGINGRKINPIITAFDPASEPQHALAVQDVDRGLAGGLRRPRRAG